MSSRAQTYRGRKAKTAEKKTEYKKKTEEKKEEKSVEKAVKKVEEKTEIKSDSEAKPEEKAKSDSEDKTEAKPEEKAESDSEAKPEEKAESDYEAKTEEKAKSDSEAKPEEKTEEKAKSDSEAKPEEKTEAKPEEKTEDKNTKVLKKRAKLDDIKSSFKDYEKPVPEKSKTVSVATLKELEKKLSMNIDLVSPSDIILVGAKTRSPRHIYIVEKVSVEYTKKKTFTERNLNVEFCKVERFFEKTKAGNPKITEIRIIPDYVLKTFGLSRYVPYAEDVFCNEIYSKTEVKQYQELLKKETDYQKLVEIYVKEDEKNEQMITEALFEAVSKM